MPENAKSPPEPSMEEIIASISRIITDEKRPVEPVRPVPAKKSEILELTEVVEEDGSVRRVTRAAQNSNAPSAAPTATADTSVASAAARSEPGISRPEAASDRGPEPGRERILSSAASGAAAAAFAQLGSLTREQGREGDLALGGRDRTLEDTVRDLLRPLLQTWLDEHLPGIVERLVREEITRVAGDAGLR
jgi:cell pole-organizing protein PopZ